MAVIDVTKMWSKTGGALSSENADPLEQAWTVTEGYQVLAQIGDSVDVIVAASGIPLIGSKHPTGIEAYCKSVSPQQISPIFWQVLIGYEGEAIDSSIKVKWTDAATTEPIDRDWNGTAIVTANGEQVDGLSTDIVDQVVIIKRKFATINTATIAQYRRSTNSDFYLGWAPGTARLIGWEADNIFNYNAAQELWDVTARIQFREPYANTTAAQAWYLRWRHEGLLVNRGGVIGRAQDGLGQEVTKPVLLKLNGEEETNANNAEFIHTQVKGSLPYSGLGLI